MSEYFTLIYFTNINCDRQQVILHSANTIYLRTFSSSKYLKYSRHQHFQIIANQICIAIQLLANATQSFTTCLTRQQQVLRTHSR